MKRRSFIGAVFSLSACASAGVSTDDLRKKVAAEIGQVVVNRGQLRPWMTPPPLRDADIEARIADVRERVAASHASLFQVPELNMLRRFYSSDDGQILAALAYAQEGNRPKNTLSQQTRERVEAALSDPVIARSVSSLRVVLGHAFKTAFAFPSTRP